VDLGTGKGTEVRKPFSDAVGSSYLFMAVIETEPSLVLSVILLGFNSFNF
jgi:hypothetical protein